MPSSSLDKAAAIAAESVLDCDICGAARSSKLATVECAPSTVQIAIAVHARTLSVPWRESAARMLPVWVIATVESYRGGTKGNATTAKAATVGPKSPTAFPISATRDSRREGLRAWSVHSQEA